MKFKYLLLLATTFLLQACVLAPLSNNYTARSIGKGNWDVSAGASVINTVQPYARIGVGITDNLDIGAVGEVGNSFLGGVWGKYAFINNPQDLSLGLVAGGGLTGGKYKFSGNIIKGKATVNAFYLYGGPIISYKLNWWEPYFVGRYNYIGSKKTGTSYGQLTLGNNIWFTDKFGFNINGDMLFVDKGTGFYGCGGIIYRF